MDEADAFEDSAELMFELSAIVANLCEAMANKFMDSIGAFRKKKDILELLLLAKTLVEDAYNEPKEDEEEKEARLYDAMVFMYNEFISRNNINESKIIKELQECNETDIDLVVSNDTAHFVVTKLDDKLSKKLLELGDVYLENVDLEAEPVMEAFHAGIVATILYDKAFGECSPKKIFVEPGTKGICSAINLRKL